MLKPVRQWLNPLLLLSLMLWLYVWRVKRSWNSIRRLEGQIVVLTGASSGLGERLAHRLYAAGCRLIMMSRSAERLDEVRSELLHSHQPAMVYPPVVVTFDLASPSEVTTAMRHALALYGRVDMLINNAGLSYRGEVVDTDPEVDARLMQVNYLSQVIAVKTLLPSMLERQRGHIVCISSVQGRIAIPFRSAYGASKHALHAFCDCLRAEVAASDVRVTTVAPGYINTNLSRNALTATGQAYSKMDASTAGGMSADAAADGVISAILSGRDEVLMTSYRDQLAILLRSVCPRLYFCLMKLRAKWGHGKPTTHT